MQAKLCTMVGQTCASSRLAAAAAAAAAARMMTAVQGPAFSFTAPKLSSV
jgi:hypothetical protein